MLPAVTCAAWCLCAASAGQTPTIDLTPKFESGQVTTYRLVLDDTQTVEIVDHPEAKQHSASHQELSFDLRTDSFDPDEGGRLTLELTSLKGSIDLGGLEVEFDSTKPDPQGHAASVAALVGLTLSVKVAPDGRITEIEEFTPTDDMTKAVIQQQVLAPGLVRSSFGPVLSTGHPPGVARVGQSWTYEDHLHDTPFGAMVLATRHQLKGVRGTSGDVTFEGRLESDADHDHRESGSPEITVRKSAYSGNYTWDARAGQLSTMDCAQEMELHGHASNMAMLIRRNVKMRVERVDDSHD